MVPISESGLFTSWDLIKLAVLFSMDVNQWGILSRIRNEFLRQVSWLLLDVAGLVQCKRYVASFQCLKSCCLPVFLCQTSENGQAPIFPHFLNRAQPPIEPAGQMGALWGCVCACTLQHVFVCVFPPAWVWCILGVEGNEGSWFYSLRRTWILLISCWSFLSLGYHLRPKFLV